ncbi:MAG: TIGR03668 family PPOX class F420-dependent oxidoreductase, partial [bacterium]
LTPQQIGFIERQRVAHLATTDGTGQPHVLPICFAVAGGAIYTVIDEKPKRVAAVSLRRVRNILARPRVSLVWDHYEEDWTRLAWLQVRGTAALVEAAAERGAALAALRDRYPQYRAMDLEPRPLIRITPTHVRSWTASRA